jgi:hypothetical protein
MGMRCQWGVCSFSGCCSTSLFAVARILAVQYAHHRGKEQVFALLAGVAVIGAGGLHLECHFVAHHFNFASCAQGQHLVAAHPLQPVQSAVGLGHRIAGHQDAVGSS